MRANEIAVVYALLHRGEATDVEVLAQLAALGEGHIQRGLDAAFHLHRPLQLGGPDVVAAARDGAGLPSPRPLRADKISTPRFKLPAIQAAWANIAYRAQRRGGEESP